MKHFSLKELCRSNLAASHGIDNTPPQEAIDNLRALADAVLDPLRELYGKPVTVTSGYRCAELNALVGGAPSSQHLAGQAADIVGTPYGKEQVKVLFSLIRDNLEFDQLIAEGNFSWVHVSWRAGGNNRKQVLKL